jgi:hypothetical protein
MPSYSRSRPTRDLVPSLVTLVLVVRAVMEAGLPTVGYASPLAQGLDRLECYVVVVNSGGGQQWWWSESRLTAPEAVGGHPGGLRKLNNDHVVGLHMDHGGRPNGCLEGRFRQGSACMYPGQRSFAVPLGARW